MSKTLSPDLQKLVELGLSISDAKKCRSLNENIERLSRDLISFGNAAKTFYPDGKCTDAKLLSTVSDGYSALSQMLVAYDRIMRTPFLNKVKGLLNDAGCTL